MTDDETLIMLGAITAAAIAWWYWNQNTTAADQAASVDVSAADAVTNDLFNGISDIGLTLGIDSMAKIWTPPAAAAPYLDAIRAAESKYSLPENMLARLLQQESSYDPKIIDGTRRSPVGALGIAQFMPATAKQFGIDPLNPWQAIDAAGKYLAQLFRQFGNWADALAAYNWGPGNVKKRGIASAPTETRNYFGQILADLGLGGANA